jgi:hypothetical protein
VLVRRRKHKSDPPVIPLQEIVYVDHSSPSRQLVFLAMPFDLRQLSELGSDNGLPHSKSCEGCRGRVADRPSRELVTVLRGESPER